jgi:hypothetical protein
MANQSRILTIAAGLLLCANDSGFAEKTTYENPVDKKSYTAEWRTYTAKPKGSVAPAGKVEVGLVRLLSEQDLIGKNISVKRLAGFIIGIEKAVTAAVPKTAPAFDLIVQVTLSVGARPKFDLASNNDAPKKLLQAIYDRLEKLENIRSKTAPISFQINFKIRKKP